MADMVCGGGARQNTDAVTGSGFVQYPPQERFKDVKFQPLTPVQEPPPEQPGNKERDAQERRERRQVDPAARMLDQNGTRIPARQRLCQKTAAG